MASNKELTKSFAVVVNSLLAQTMAFGQSLARKCTAGELFLEAMDIVSDFRHDCGRVVVNMRSPENMEKDYAYIYGFAKLDFYAEPIDTDTILLATNYASSISCQRSLLEVCASKMSNSERRQILEANGSPFPRRDALYRILREPLEIGGEWFGVQQILCKQRWYKVTELGPLRTTEALYEIIRTNPDAFCALLKT